MLHTIGRKQPSGGLVDLLLACHGRIRQFLAIAIAVGEVADASLEDVGDASARVRRYFSEAFPLHVEDEEERILPRLRGRAPDVDAALDRMTAEHDQHDARLRRLRELAGTVATSPRDVDARLDLARVARELRAELEPHLEAEERVVFPAIRTRLTAEEQRSILGEVRARRQPP